MVIEPADLEWTDGLPRSRRFGDIYFSVDNGLAETRYVFLDSNRLQTRWTALPPDGHFTVGETGFGTGLNFLAAWQLWREVRPKGAWLHYVSVEKHPLRQDDLERALALWPELEDLSTQLLAEYPYLVPGWHRRTFPGERLTLTLLFGDAADLLPELDARVDAWFLDGFAPDRNPELWQLDLLRHVGRLSAPGATLATFTCAGAVRRALGESGFSVTRQKGFGRKREMIVAVHDDSDMPAPDLPRPRPYRGERHAAVIGAGIAGVSIARTLAGRGWRIDLIDRADGPGAGASGNPAAIIYPKIAMPDQAAWHFQQQAYLHLLAEAAHLPDAWRQPGLLWLLTGNQAREGDKLAGHPWRDILVEHADAAAASRLAGVPLAADCLYFPQAGYLHPGPLYHRWLATPGITCRWNTDIARITHDTDSGRWKLFDAGNAVILDTPVLILANALGIQALQPELDLPLYPVRGQISRFPTTPGLRSLRTVLSYGGYVTPAFDGEHCLGASFLPRDAEVDIREADHDHNRQLLSHFVPALASALPEGLDWAGRASLRTQSRDYLPVIGPLPCPGSANDCLPGLYASVGHGSKGFCMAPLAAEILAADLHGEPCPIPRRTRESLHPARFIARARRKGNSGKSGQQTP